MKRVTWEDRSGKKHVSILRDQDSDEYPQFGVPFDPPNLDEILDEMKILLHNELVNRGLCTYLDIQKAQNGLSSAILSVMRNRIVEAYRKNDKHL